MSGWDLSCRDWERRLTEGRSLIPDLPLNREEADLAIAVCDQLRLPDVQGNPALAEAAGQWARDIVRVLFGSFDPITKARHIEEIFALVPKKNSKTTYLGAGLMLTARMPSGAPSTASARVKEMTAPLVAACAMPPPAVVPRRPETDPILITTAPGRVR